MALQRAWSGKTLAGVSIAVGWVKENGHSVRLCDKWRASPEPVFVRTLCLMEATTSVTSTYKH